jgi:hypothetical protein
MSLCAIIPVANLQAANDALEQAGYGPRNFSVPLYSSTGASYAGMHTWGDIPFETAIKAIAGVVWEQSEGDPTTRFNALVEAQGVKWGANAPALPDAGLVVANELYRWTDGTLWTALASFDRTTYGGPPAQLPPAIIRFVRDPYQVYIWRQPTDQYDAYKLVNPFTGQNDECEHLGKRWYVTQADGAGNNVWEPGQFGWSETDPTPNVFVRAWNWLTGLFT